MKFNRSRFSFRNLHHRQDRPLNRTITRGHPRCDYLSIALRAYARAICIHRRLIKLAPEIYDAGVAHRLEQEHFRQVIQRKTWGPVLARVYGETDFQPAEPTPFSRLPSNPRTYRVIESEESQRAAWMQIAHDARQDFQKLQPHTVLNLTQIARLLDIGITFGRLATGQDRANRKPDPEPQDFGYLSCEAALEKLYGSSTEPPQTQIGKEIVKEW